MAGDAAEPESVKFKVDQVVRDFRQHVYERSAELQRFDVEHIRCCTSKRLDVNLKMKLLLSQVHSKQASPILVITPRPRTAIDYKPTHRKTAQRPGPDLSFRTGIDQYAICPGYHRGSWIDKFFEAAENITNQKECKEAAARLLKDPSLFQPGPGGRRNGSH